MGCVQSHTSPTSGGPLPATTHEDTGSIVGMYSWKQHLVDVLKKKDIKLVIPQVFFDHWQRQTRLPRCQDVPPKYILDVDALSDVQVQTMEVISVSYCWISSSHPDPECYHLEAMHCLLQKFVAGRFVMTKEYLDDGRRIRARADDVLGAGDGRPVGVFLDWMSVPQQPRSDEDKEVFHRALGSINLWYAHSSTTTWMLTSLPPGVTRASYGDSGWTTFERHVSGLISPTAKLLEIGADVRSKLVAGGFEEDDYYQLSLRISDTVRGAPAEPEAFARDVRAKHFTNGADCDKVVIPRYEETFRAVMAEATKIDHRGLPVGDQEFRKIMAVFQRHSDTERIEMINFSRAELCLPLEEVVTAAEGFVNLKELSVADNKVGGSLSNVGKLQKLTMLRIHGSQVAGSTKDLVNLVHLQALTLSQTKVTGSTEDLARLRKLTNLSIFQTEVTGSTADLAKLEHLTNLSFDDTQVSGSTVDLAKLEHLTNLTISFTQVSGSTKDLVRLQNLTELCFTETPVSGTTEDLARLEHLTVLRFNDTQVSGSTGDLRKLLELSVLAFASTQVSGCKEDLDKLSLKYLNYYNTPAYKTDQAKTD